MKNSEGLGRRTRLVSNPVPVYQFRLIKTSRRILGEFQYLCIRRYYIISAIHLALNTRHLAHSDYLPFNLKFKIKHQCECYAKSLKEYANIIKEKHMLILI